MEAMITRDQALSAWKEALEHKKEARQQFENWLQERGIEGKVVTCFTPYEQSMLDVKEGRVYEAKDVDDLFKKMGIDV